MFEVVLAVQHFFLVFQVPDHFRSDCPNAEKPCDFVEEGCSYSVWNVELLAQDQLERGVCKYVVVHINVLPPKPRPVIPWIELAGKRKWLPLNFGYQDVICTRHVAKILERGLHSAGGLGELPRKILNSRWRIPQL